MQVSIPPSGINQPVDETVLYNIGIERAFLACIIQNPKLIYEAENKITPNDLYHPSHRYLYNVILHLKKRLETHNKKLSFDISILLSEASRLGKKDIFEEKVGGLEYLQNIANFQGISFDSFHNYIDTLLCCSLKVQAYRKTIHIQELLFSSHNKEPDEILNEIQTNYSSLNKYSIDNEIRCLGDGIMDFLKECELVHEGKISFGVNITFLPQLMNVLNKIRRRQFIILFARPKTGKSTFLLNIAIDVAAQNIPVLYLDTEMTEDEQRSRALSKMSGIREWDILEGKYLDSEQQKETLYNFAKLLQELPIHYIAAKGWSIDSIISKIKQFQMRYVGTEKVDGIERTKDCLIIYDWLKIPDKGDLKSVKEYQELGFIATKLNDVISQLDIPLIAGAQANREGNQQDVGLKSALHAQNFLADSDRLLRFCTCLMWLRRLNLQEKELAKDLPPELFFNQMIHVLDQRKGPVCLEGICLDFNGNVLTYTEKPYTDLDELKKKQKENTVEESVNIEEIFK
ncbi:MAG: DnaB-like helicase C-terminal domain-containing protein [Candidatus Njordarchaeia archaeon]